MIAEISYRRVPRLSDTRSRLSDTRYSTK